MHEDIAATATMIAADGRAAEVPARVEGPRVFISAAALTTVTGWKLQPSGLCRGDVCVPTRAHPDLLRAGSDRDLDAGAQPADEPWIDVTMFAELTRVPVVVDAAERVIAFGTPAQERSDELRSLAAPDFRVEDVDGHEVGLTDFAGRKKMLVAFASWCGCAYDLPAWQAMQDELADERFSIIGVAVDERAEDVAPFTDGITFPVLLDRDHVITERYDIRNVPTVVWIDEEDQIVRPNDVAFGTDMFRDFHNIDSQPHHEALRRWVTTGEAPLAEHEVLEHVPAPTADEQLARAHWRAAIVLHRAGRTDAAARHFDRAGELAPHDFTIRRGSMPLRGIDPFLSDEFIELFESFNAAGRPGYGFGHDGP